MSQSYDLRIATETIANDAQQLGVTVKDLQRIQVQVTITLMHEPELSLQLQYCVMLPLVSLSTQLDWPIWQADNVRFTNFLWEETCLECFVTGSSISGDNTAPYIEINANPDGRYALYQFDSYRNPAVLPPVPLLEIDGYTRASIKWLNKPNLHNASEYHSYQLCYERSFRVALTQLSSSNPNVNQQYAINNTIVRQLHPCVILWFGETALYFAPEHASPPDFHNQRYWSRFTL